MTPIEARLHTLNEIIEFAKKEQKQYEGEDEWVIINNDYPPIHYLEIGDVLEMTRGKDEHGDYKFVTKGQVDEQWVNEKCVENRKQLSSEYFALQTVIDECNRKIKLYDNQRS